MDIVRRQNSVNSDLEAISAMVAGKENVAKGNCKPCGNGDLFPTPKSESIQDESSLKLERTADGELFVHSVVPEGVKVTTGEYGRCLVATKAFPAGSTLYRGYAILTDTSSKEGRYYLYLYDDDEMDKKKSSPAQVFCLDDLNSVKDYWDPSNQSIRQVYGFDGFMNHSCNANVYCPLVYRTKDFMCYDAIALRDIPSGEEISCDYACFDYDCNGHEIETCGCQAPNCRGEMRGFKGLSLAEKIRIMPMTESEVIDEFFRDNPDMVLIESKVPSQSVRLETTDKDDGEIFMVATKEYAPGDLIFSNQATIIETNDLPRQTFILKLVEFDRDNKKRARYHLLDKEQHFIYRPSYVECVGFDSYMDHSCDPNVEQHYENATTYHVYARRTIHPGDKITCDYELLDNEAMKQPNVAKTRFICQCGADNCRTEIFA